MKDLNELRDRAYKTACEHGFHDEKWSDEHLLCLVVCELMESVQADRKDCMAERKMFENLMEANKVLFTDEEQDDRFIIAFDNNIKNSVEDELSDACIFLFDIAGLRNLNIDKYEHFDSVSEKKTFTENIYVIVKDITNYKYSLQTRVNAAFSQVFELADILNIDLMWFIETKMKYNETRPYKHGCKY